MTNIIRKNPKQVPDPVGLYSHITKIPKDADLFVLSGQIGTEINGNIPILFNEQVCNTLQNIQKILNSENLQPENIIKVNIWSVEEIDWTYFYEQWKNLFKDDYPSMTVGYIDALGLPEIKIEIEIWAAK
ncbi:MULTISPECIES: RidA family protein [Enterococcus]|jgi:enamine deaminase RidA (YjgF/YER057c/UK114 family)|uniref:RidA family protein n=1 Tax=Enterococcus TaxID=1350 RepID=UPI002DB876D0|nr:RidA family protein [Enterococcus faecalis]MEB8383853.1 RidA family protein [Enterococcus faecalis]